MATKKKEAVALVKVDDFRIVKADPATVLELIEENLGGGSGSLKMDLIRIPAGARLSFSVPTLSEGDEAEVDHIDGIIIGRNPQRAMWEKSMEESGGGSPPDCFSIDNVHGVGDPGGLCADCSCDEWGSGGGEKNRKKKCKEMIFVTVVREDELLPVAIVASPGSLGAVDDYMKRLTAKGIFFYGALTRFTLEKKTNKMGQDYSHLVLTKLEGIEGEALARVKAYKEKFKPILEGRGFDVTDDEVAGGAEDGESGD